jgi:hypothetical protein
MPVSLILGPLASLVRSDDVRIVPVDYILPIQIDNQSFNVYVKKRPGQQSRLDPYSSLLVSCPCPVPVLNHPVLPRPVLPLPDLSCLVLVCLVLSCLVLSGLVLSGLVRSGVWSGLVWCLVLSGLVWCLVWSGLV